MKGNLPDKFAQSYGFRNAKSMYEHIKKEEGSHKYAAQRQAWHEVLAALFIIEERLS